MEGAVATERLDHAGDEAVPPLDGEAPRAGKRRRGNRLQKLRGDGVAERITYRERHDVHACGDELVMDLW